MTDDVERVAMVAVPISSGFARASDRFQMGGAAQERQARRNHGNQSLGTLARRGGLSWCEALAIIEGRDWQPMDQAKAEVAVRQHLQAQEQSR